MRPLPPLSQIHWRRLDVTGHEESRIERTPHGWRITGTVYVEEDNNIAASLVYDIECDDSWRTRSTRVDGTAGDRIVHIALTTDGAGNWRRDGVALRDLAGAIDIDLGFSPATNTLPIRRLSLEVGETRRVTSAWLRFPELRLEPLEQTYTREADHVFRYQALVDGEAFTARLDTDAYGRVLRYEGLWAAETVRGV